jgi:hypothetical protein
MAQNLRGIAMLMVELGGFLLSCESLPQKWHEPLYVPILMTIVGATIYGLGMLSETREGKPKAWKWSSMLFLLLGLYSGGSITWCMTDSFYMSLVSDYGRKMLLGHIGGFVIPLVAILTIGVIHWRISRDPYR